MITVEQIMLKLVELNDIGRASLLRRGVTTHDGITTEEIMQKIGDIPIYKFEQPIKGEVDIFINDDYKVELDGSTQNNSITVETEIILERGT
jgi:hypothetical protein